MSHECTPLKTAYDTCFQSWYTTKFLKHAEERADSRPPTNARANPANTPSTDSKAHSDMGMDECDELFKAYKGCVMVSRLSHILFIFLILLESSQRA